MCVFVFVFVCVYEMCSIVYHAIFLQVQRAEVKMCILLAQHNIPLALADHLSPLIQDIFDGEVAKGYSCAKFKTCVLNNAIALEFQCELISLMQQSPYSLCIDGSNDIGLLKMNPLLESLT